MPLTTTTAGPLRAVGATRLAVTIFLVALNLRAAVAALPPLVHVEYFHDHARIEQMLFEGALPARDGALHPGEAPGLGLELRADVARQFRAGG